MNSDTLERPGLTGRIMAPGERAALCTGDDGCFPAPDELTRLATAARRGKPAVAFVGTGHPDTVLVCPHGRWRLGDQMVQVSEPCLRFFHDDCRDPACRCSHHELDRPATEYALRAAPAGDGELQAKLAALQARVAGLCTGTKKDNSPCNANVVPGTTRCVAHGIG